MAGGHPTETLEATFDVVHEESTNLHLIEAETMLVGFQIVQDIVGTPHNSRIASGGMTTSWHIRLGNTRLADAILDLCGVPSNEKVRKVCLDFLAASSFDKQSQVNTMAKTLHGVCEEEGLPDQFLFEMNKFLIAACPLSADISQALDQLQAAIISLRKDPSKKDYRRMKRFEDAARQLKSLHDLVGCLKDLSVVNDEQPTRVLLDLGLRQKRKHYHGGTIYQYTVLLEQPCDHTPKRDIKVAEGGAFWTPLSPHIFLTVFPRKLFCLGPTVSTTW